MQIAEDLAIIRSNVVFIYVMMNFLWCVIALQLQAMEDSLKTFYIVEKYEPLSLVFLAVFAVVLLLQFLSMLVHRWGTFLHLMASTRIDWCNKSHSEEDFARYVVNQTKLLQNLEPCRTTRTTTRTRRASGRRTGCRCRTSTPPCVSTLKTASWASRKRAESTRRWVTTPTTATLATPTCTGRRPPAVSSLC